MHWLSFFRSIDWLGVIFLFTLVASLILTVIGKAVQLRALPKMAKLLLQGPRVSKDHQAHAHNSIDPRKALWTAMSTTIGTGNIFGPMIAIGFAGPGTLIAYLLATFLGAATTYTEVFFAMRYRKKFTDGTIQAGPMAYIQETLPKGFSWGYALSGSILLATWSMSQSHTVAHMLIEQHIPCWLTGALLAFFVIYAIFSGIQWIARLNTILVPVMFVLYVSACIAIFSQHMDQLPATLQSIIDGFWNPRSLITGVAVFSFFDVLRWGLARALQSNEAGVGTSTIPHSLSQGDAPSSQAILAMASVYSNGVLCLMSGLIFLMSGAYEKVQVGAFDASVVTEIFRSHFAIIGEPLILVIILLFTLGTILGNAYNGTRCFAYLTHNRWNRWYTLAAGACIFAGSLLELHVVWSYIDYFIIPVAVPNIIALVILARRHREAYHL